MSVLVINPKQNFFPQFINSPLGKEWSELVISFRRALMELNKPVELAN